MRRSVVSWLFLLFVSLAVASAQKVTLAINNVLSPGGATVTVPIVLSGGAKPAALQWTMSYDPSSITAVTVAAAATATAAGKSTACANGVGKTICVLYGLNQTGINDGPIANVTFQTLTAAASSPITLGAPVAAAGNGTGIPADILYSILTVGSGLTSFVCSPATVIGPATIACTVTVATAATAATNITLVSNNPNITVPPSITLKPGALTGTFPATVKAITGGNQTGAITAMLGSDAQTTNVIVSGPNAAVKLASVSCSPATIVAGGSTGCTVSLTAASPSGGVRIILASGSAGVQAPSSVTVPPGNQTSQFTATTATTAAAGSTSLAGTLMGSTQSALLTIVRPQISSLTCHPTTVVAGTAVSCTVSLASVAPVPVGVTLSSSTPVLSMPSSVTIPSGTLAAQIQAQTLPVSANMDAAVTATVLGRSVNAHVTIEPAPRFLLRGNQTEIIGTVNGSIVSPSFAPAGLKGTLHVHGSGYVNFTPIDDRDGLQFNAASGGAAAFIAFRGAAVGTLFPDHGEISFDLKSLHSFAERRLLGTETLFEVQSGFRQLFHLSIYSTAGRLMFVYSAGNPRYSTYVVPAGQEDAVIGKGVITSFTIAWDGRKTTLSIKGQPVQSTSTMKVNTTWDATGSMTIGATSNGYDPFRDAIANFQIR